MTEPLRDRFASQIPWVQLRNDSGMTIPPFSFVSADGWTFPDPTNPVGGQIVSPFFSAVQPDGTGNQIDLSSIYITSNVAIPPASGNGPNGLAARPIEYPQLVAINGGQNLPGQSSGRYCGPTDGSWQASLDQPGFTLCGSPQRGYALVTVSAPAQIMLYQTIAGPGSTTYPLLSQLPTVYYAQLLNGATFPLSVGAQTLQPIGNQATAAYDYVWCDQTYLFQGTIVATLNGIVIGLVTGSSFQIGMAGTLGEALAAGGSAVANVVYVDALGNTVNDILTVWENVGLPSGQTIASGTGVFIEWDNSLFNWVVVSAACGTNKGGQDTPISRQKSDTPISTGGSPGDGF
jgi:hypothetical protein